MADVRNRVQAVEFGCRVMIQCDEVFEILTRGPFPTGAASDSLVEAHLTRCADCRRLAEALRPAMVAAPEAVAPEEGINLPCYGGVLAGQPPQRPYARSSRTSRNAGTLLGAVTWPSLCRLATPLMQFAAAAAVGCVLAVGMVRWDVQQLRLDVGAPVAPSGAQATHAVVPARAVIPASDQGEAGSRAAREAESSRFRWTAQISLACTADDPQSGRGLALPPSGGAARQAGAYQCCTHCHAASSPAPVSRGTAQVATACRSCH